MKGAASFWYSLIGLLFLTLEPTQVLAAPVSLNTNIQLRLVLNTIAASGSPSIRIAKDPRNSDLYYSKFNGDIYRITLQPGNGTSTSTKLHGAADHGISDSAQGMAIGPDGTIYLVGNFTTDGGNRTFARIVKGVPQSGGGRVWSLLALTEAYPRSRTAFDHVFNGIEHLPVHRHDSQLLSAPFLSRLPAVGFSAGVLMETLSPSTGAVSLQGYRPIWMLVSGLQPSTAICRYPGKLP